jgi:hypothetical protein
MGLRVNVRRPMVPGRPSPMLSFGAPTIPTIPLETNGGPSSAQRIPTPPVVPAYLAANPTPPQIRIPMPAEARASSVSTPKSGTPRDQHTKHRRQSSTPIVEPELTIAQAPPPKARGRPPKGSTAFTPTPNDAEKWIRPVSEFRQIAVVLKEAMRKKFGTGAEYENRYRQLNANRQQTIYAPAKKMNMWVDWARLPFDSC